MTYCYRNIFNAKQHIYLRTWNKWSSIKIKNLELNKKTIEDGDKVKTYESLSRVTFPSTNVLCFFANRNNGDHLAQIILIKIILSLFDRKRDRREQGWTLSLASIFINILPDQGNRGEGNRGDELGLGKFCVKSSFDIKRDRREGNRGDELGLGKFCVKSSFDIKRDRGEQGWTLSLASIFINLHPDQGDRANSSGWESFVLNLRLIEEGT